MLRFGAVLGLLLLTGVAGTSVAESTDSDVGCAFAPVADKDDFERKLRAWGSSIHPQPILRWGLGLDRNRARVEIQWPDDEIVVSWALDGRCQPTDLRVESPGAKPGPRLDPRALLVISADLAADLAAATDLRRASGGWAFDTSLLAVSFLLLVILSARALYREATLQRRAPGAVGTLLLLWMTALGLRLTLSPRTFLHEGYHIAETLSAYIAGDMPPAYGNTGPALFHLAATLTQHPVDPELIHLTNLVLASLAIPALALFDLALLGSWPRALCSAALLCALPLHLRYSAAEDLFLQATTFSLWTLAMFAAYLRSPRLDLGLGTVLALSLTMQARPEMLFFPAVLVGLVLLDQPRAWRLLVAPRALALLALLLALLVPRLLDLQEAMRAAPTPGTTLPRLVDYFGNLVLLQPEVTPPILLIVCLVGFAAGMRRKPGFHLWVVLVYLVHTLITLSIFINVPYGLRSQLPPTTYVLLLGGGVATAWETLGKRWAPATRRSRRWAMAMLALLVFAVALASLHQARPFLTELGDLQLEWAYLRRTVPRLPARATLLTATEAGGANIAAFPLSLLALSGKQYETVDVRQATRGTVAWPSQSENLLYYQGMYCYLPNRDEPREVQMTEACLAVRQRYELEALWGEEAFVSATPWQSYLANQRGPFRIGFFRLRPRAVEPPTP